MKNFEYEFRFLTSKNRGKNKSLFDSSRLLFVSHNAAVAELKTKSRKIELCGTNRTNIAKHCLIN